MPPEFSVVYLGTDIAFFGNTPHLEDTLEPFKVSIDSDEVYKAFYPEARTNCQWFTSYTLNDSKIHTIEFSQLNNIVVDFAVITVGDHTPLFDSTIIVDDSNEEIFWDGQWNEHEGLKYVTGTLNTDVGRPFGNGTKESTNVGDSMEFTFAGTSVALYGIFDWRASGSVTVDFTVTNPILESSPPYFEQRLFTFLTPNDPQLLNSTNYLLFNHSSLASGNHTLTLNVTSIFGSRSLIIDYLTYEPNFGSLRDKPHFTSTPASNPEPNNTTGNTSSDKSLNTKAIAGGVIGGMFVTFTLGLFVWYQRRRGYQFRNILTNADSLEVASPQANDMTRSNNLSPNIHSSSTFFSTFLHSSRHHQITTTNRAMSSNPSSRTIVTPFPYGISTHPAGSKGDPLAHQSVNMPIQRHNEELRELNGQVLEMMAHSQADPNLVPASREAAEVQSTIRLLNERIEFLAREIEQLGGYSDSGPPPIYMQETTAVINSSGAPT
ncbi:hypothetical protein VKT23_008189 [Stygiomarasmius scandens]|uniref:CUB-like domain-containing protein n=1 Tax=Marasmiellus scandens TaxID=2682957 RepID=A0ABR1JHJ4_9AGAR